MSLRLKLPGRHCEARSDEAIQPFVRELDCFASLAMTSDNSTGKRRAAEQATVAIKHDDLDGDIAAGDETLRRLFRRTRDFVAQRDTFGPGQRKRFGGVVGSHYARGETDGGASCRRP